MCHPKLNPIPNGDSELILQKACRFLASFAFLICAGCSASQSEKSPEKTIVFFSNESCGTCKIEKKTLDEMGVKYVQGSGDKNAGIQYYPTIVILVDGKEVSRIVGNKSKEELKKLLEN